VLAVLEDRLHTLAHEVVREGRRITLFGLGPSPRAVNPRDKTMIDVRASDGVTTIDADVTFQASSFLGDAPQDEIVLGKLERVFEEIKAELGLNARREVLNGTPLPRKVIPIGSAMVERAAAIASVPEVAGIPEATVEMAPAAEDVSSAVIEKRPIEEIEHVLAEAAPVVALNEVPVEAAPTAAVEPVGITAEPTTTAVDELPIFLQERAPIAVVKPQASAPVEMKQRFEDWIREAIVLTHKEERGGRGKIGWVAGGACVGLAIVLGARYLAVTQGAALAIAQPAPVAATALAPMSASVPVAATNPAPATLPQPVPEPPRPGAVEDPAEVVKQWEQAMQSRDAAAQAAFYADTVERYFLRNNVGRDAVQADKQAEIDKRKGSWTMKMDRVKVFRSGDLATVGLVKHFTVQQEGEPASEWFVPTQLKLKREDGRWRIVSERALGWASSLDDLDG
jgi:ketosteroid isomerase-like protein